MNREPRRIVTDSMIGLEMPEFARLSARVVTVLGHNPSPFTGPGTNTYLVGQGRRPILLDTGQGVAVWADLLDRALRELCDADGIESVLLTHAHIDHTGGVEQVRAKFGDVTILKKPWPGHDGAAGRRLKAIEDGAIVRTEGATIRAIHTPGHAPDHLCYYLDEEQALFTGDLILGAGTTVIPEGTGDLGDYLASLKRLMGLELDRIYPGHGPVIFNPKTKIREYIAHRELRERQIIAALSEAGEGDVMGMVRAIYTDVPSYLHRAAASSVRSHLRKLQKEGRAVEHEGRWSLA
jgi:endoribonuclease LACTB2